MLATRVLITATLFSLISIAFASPVSDARSNPSLASRQDSDPLRQYRITNNCPAPINLYIGIPEIRSVIETGEIATEFLGTGAGFFYTDANGGSPTGDRTARVGFYPDNGYYIVRDPEYLNVGVEVLPQDRQPRQGLCLPRSCETSICTNAFSSPPRDFPPPEQLHPPSPFNNCPFANTTYDITFCPSGSWPVSTQGGEVHPNYTPNKCMDVQGGVFLNGTPVQVYDCNGTAAQRWVIVYGESINVRLANTDFCLDAGNTPSNGRQLVIRQCDSSRPGQKWNYAADSKLVLAGTAFCADLDSGDLTNGNEIQVWECQDFNPNQLWSI